MLKIKIKLRVLRLRTARALALSLCWALWPLELLSYQIGSSLVFLLAHLIALPLNRARRTLQRKAQAQARELDQDLKVLQQITAQARRRERIDCILSKSSIGVSEPELPGGDR